MKTILSTVSRVIILSFILFLSYSVASLMVGLGTPSGSSPSSSSAVLWLFAASLLSSMAVSYPVIRSKWYGWRLVLTIFTIFYGVTTFQSQIETVVFLQYLVNVIPVEIVPKLFVQGIIVSAIFSVSAVLIHGKVSGKEHEWSEKLETQNVLNMPLKTWIWKLGLIAVIYVTIYISFGMFVFRPLAGDAFQEFYAGLQLPAWIIPFQMLRGLIWAALALPVIKMMNGRLWEIKLAVALLFSILMGSLLLIPNPYMPDAIRFAHLVEVSSSNFVFGWIVAAVLCWRRE